MRHYTIRFGPNWCEGWLVMDIKAISEDDAIYKLDLLMKRGMSDCDITHLELYRDGVENEDSSATC